MFSIVDTHTNKIVRKNIVSRKDLVWPDGFVSPGYSEVGETHQMSRFNSDDSVDVVNHWKLYEDDVVINEGKAGQKLRLGPPIYDVELDCVFRDMMPVGETQNDKLSLSYITDDHLKNLLGVIVKEISLRGESASKEFEELALRYRQHEIERKTE